VAISTPLGSDNLFARLHARAASGELPHAAAFTATTEEMNARINPVFLESERISDASRLSRTPIVYIRRPAVRPIPVAANG
jgi:hypothetical protein